MYLLGGEVLLANRAIRLAREAGALSTLPAALNAFASLHVLAGDLARAAELAAEETAITQAIGAPPLPNARLLLAAWSGRQHDTLEQYAAMVEEATARGEGGTVGLAEATLAALHNGLGNYDDALAAATPPWEHDDLTYSSQALPEVVEAASRAEQPERAAAALEQLSSRARASGTQYALGLAARSRALTTAGPDAEELYLEAIDHLGRCRLAAHLARARLVYGEWLRREGRRQDAREQLRTAHQMLSDMGVAAFAERAARELRATGEHPRKRAAQPTDELTAHELQIARLVATGATTRGRRPAVPEPAHDRGPPAQHLPQARHHLPSAAQGSRAVLTVRWAPCRPTADDLGDVHRCERPRRVRASRR